MFCPNYKAARAKCVEDEARLVVWVNGVCAPCVRKLDDHLHVKASAFKGVEDVGVVLIEGRDGEAYVIGTWQEFPSVDEIRSTKLARQNGGLVIDRPGCATCNNCGPACGPMGCVGCVGGSCGPLGCGIPSFAGGYSSGCAGGACGMPVMFGGGCAGGACGFGGGCSGGSCGSFMSAGGCSGGSCGGGGCASGSCGGGGGRGGFFRGRR